MKFTRIAVVLFSIIFLFAAHQAFAGSCSSTGGGGLWTSGATWTGTCGGVAGIPALGDTVTIASGSPVTVNTSFQRLTALTIEDLLDDTVGLSYLITADQIVINSGGELKAGSANIELTGTSDTLFTLNSGGTFTQGTSTLRISGNGDATIFAGSPTVYNLSILGTGTKTQGSAITFATGGTLSVTSGTYATSGNSITANGSNTLTVTNATVTAPSAFEVDYPFATRTLGTGSTVDYNEGSPQTIYNGITYYNLKISGSTTKSLSAETTVTNSVIPTSATFDTAGYTLNAGRINMQGGSFTPGSSTVNLTGTSGTLVYIGSGTLTPGTSTFNLTGNGDATVVAGGQSFYNLTSSGTGTKTVGGSLGFLSGGTLSITAGTFDAGRDSSSANSSTTLSVTNATLKVGGNVFTDNFSGFSTVTFGADSTVDYSWIADQTIDSTKTYVNLTLSGDGTKSLNGTTTVTGVFSITGSAAFTTTTSNYDLSIGSLVLDGGTISPNASTVSVTGTGGPLITFTSGGQMWDTATFNFTGNGDALIQPNGVPAYWSFYNLILSGSGTKTAGSVIDIQGGSFSITNGIFDPETYTHTSFIGGSALSVSGSGTLYVRAATFAGNFSGFATPTFGTGSTVVYNGTGSQTVLNSAPYYNLTIPDIGTEREVEFPSTGTTTVTNTFTASGSDGNILGLKSPTTGVAWTFLPSGSASVSYVSVRDGACASGAVFVTQTEFTDLGSNGTCWVPAVVTAVVTTARGAVFAVQPVRLDTARTLDFVLNGGSPIAKSRTIAVEFSADPTIVSGYAISLDPSFVHDGIHPYTGVATTFELPNVPGEHTVHLMYFSSTGHHSPVFSRTVSYQMNGARTSSSSAAAAQGVFIRTLRTGSQGKDVAELQALLVKEGMLVMPSGVSYGYFGGLTKKAVQSFQEKYAIASSATPGYGTFGPKTKARAEMLLSL